MKNSQMSVIIIIVKIIITKSHTRKPEHGKKGKLRETTPYILNRLDNIFANVGYVMIETKQSIIE